jgi:hypothetical protein
LRLFAPNVRLRVGRAVLVALVAGAGVFYALALGFGPYDPYDLGFQARPLLAGLAVVGASLAMAGARAALALLAGDLLAYATGLYANLWDALFDPLLVAVAAAVLARDVFARRRKRLIL